MQFANIITKEIKDTLPTTMVDGDKTITGADITHWAKEGWRTITETDAPATGYRVGTYGIQELSGTTCKLTVATSINIADEAAAEAAAYAAALATQLAETKALAKSLYPGPGDIRNVSPEAVARLLLAECVVIYTWLFTAAASGGHVPTKTPQEVTDALYAAIDAQV